MIRSWRRRFCSALHAFSQEPVSLFFPRFLFPNSYRLSWQREDLCTTPNIISTVLIWLKLSLITACWVQLVSYLLSDAASLIIFALWATSKLSGDGSLWATTFRVWLTTPGIFAETARSIHGNDLEKLNHCMVKFLWGHMLLPLLVSIVAVM
jgi:hypothetical protein